MVHCHAVTLFHYKTAQQIHDDDLCRKLQSIIEDDGYSDTIKLQRNQEYRITIGWNMLSLLWNKIPTIMDITSNNIDTDICPQNCIVWKKKKSNHYGYFL